MTNFRRRASTLGLLLAAAVLVGTAPAAAQEDPYGGTTTTTAAPGGSPTCTLTLGEARAGATVTATVANVEANTTVRILFGGDEVASEVAEDTTLSIDFVVPDRPPGVYVVAAVSATFTQECASASGEGFEVLGASASQGGGSGGVGGPLPKTGIYIAGFLALAVVLFLVGRGLLEASRRRARRQVEPIGAHLVGSSRRSAE